MTKRKIAKRWNNRALEQSNGAVERRGGRFSTGGTEHRRGQRTRVPSVETERPRAGAVGHHSVATHRIDRAQSTEAPNPKWPSA